MINRAATQARYRASHKEQIAAYNRAVKQAHPEVFARRAREYYQDNKLAVNDARRRNPFSLLSILQRNAAKRDIECSLTREQFKEWWDAQVQQCSYCDIPVARLATSMWGKDRVKRLTIDRIDNDKGYIPGNLALACTKCNFIKSDILTATEMREIGQKYMKPKWQS